MAHYKSRRSLDSSCLHRAPGESNGHVTGQRRYPEYLDANISKTVVDGGSVAVGHPTGNSILLTSCCGPLGRYSLI